MVVGLVVVLVSTPVYLAQDPADGLLAPGSSFTLPDVRYGDRIEYEMILQQEGLPATSTGPLFVIEYLEPSEEQRTEGVVLILKRTLPAMNVDLGPAVLFQDEHVGLHHYNAKGDLVTTQTMTHTWGSDATNLIGQIADREGPIVQSFEKEPGILPGFTGFAPSNREITVLYEPPNTWASIFSPMTNHAGLLLQSMPGPTPPENNQEKEEHAPFAAVHNNRTLYATDVKDEHWGEQSFVIEMPAWAPTENGIRLQSLTLELALTWKEPFAADGPIQKWNWWTPDLPIQAGTHLSLLGSSGTGPMAIDLVPSEFQRGNQSVERSDEGEWDPKTGHHPPMLASRLLSPEARNLPSFDYTSPIADGRSLAGLHQTLAGPSSPETIRDPMNDGAHFVGVIWEKDPQTSRWLVAFHHQNALHAAFIEYTPHPEIHDACGTSVTISGRSVEPLCETFEWGIGPHAYPRTEHDLDALPSLRESLAQRIKGPVTEFGVMRPSLFAATPPPDDPDRLKVSGAVDPFPGWPIATGGGVYLGNYDSDISAYTGYSYNGEQLVYSGTRSVESTKPMGSYRPQILAAQSSQPELVHHLGPEPLIGGFVAVLIGVAARLYVAFRAGVHLPLLALLYAKIPKGKALENNYRKTIVSLVTSEPGIPLTEVAKRTGLSQTGALHHLETLTKNGGLQRSVIGRTRHYFPTDWKDSRKRLRHAIERRPHWDEIMALIECEPGLPLHELVKRVVAPKSTVSRAGARLVALGLARKQRKGREVRFYPIMESPHRSSAHRGRPKERPAP